MPGTGPDGHDITPAEARELIRRFRENHGNDPKVVRSHRVAREIIDRILTQDGCTGLRIYHGLKPADEREGAETLVIVGVTAADDDLTTVIAEETWKCPPICSTGTTLEMGS